MFQLYEKSLFSKAIDLNKIPPIPPYKHQIGQFTLGDLHGNTIKLIFTLLYLEIYKLKHHYYEEMVNIYNKDFIIPQELVEKMIALGLPAQNTSLSFNRFMDYLFKVQNIPHVYEAILDEFHPFYYSKNLLNRDEIEKFVKLINKLEFQQNEITLRLIGDIICDRGQNDYLTLKVIEKMSYDGVSFRILASNHDAVFYTNIDLFSDSYEIFNRISNKEFIKIKDFISLDDKTILAKVKQSKNHKSLAFTKQESLDIKNFIDTNIMAIDKDFASEVSKRLVITQFKNYAPLLISQAFSYDQMLTNIIAGDIDEKEVISIFYNYYLSHLLLIDYSINKNHEFSIYTHAPITFLHLTELTNYFNINFNIIPFTKYANEQLSHQHLTEELKLTIENINEHFRNRYNFLLVGVIFNYSTPLHQFVWRRLNDIFTKQNINITLLKNLINPFENPENYNSKLYESQTEMIYKQILSYNVFELFKKSIPELASFEAFLNGIDDSLSSWELMCTDYNLIHVLQKELNKTDDFSIFKLLVNYNDYSCLKNSSDYPLFQLMMNKIADIPELIDFGGQFFKTDLNTGYLQFKEYIASDEGDAFLNILSLTSEELTQLKDILQVNDNLSDLKSNPDNYAFFINLISVIDESPFFETLKIAYTNFLEMTKFESFFSNKNAYEQFIKHIISIEDYFQLKIIYRHINYLLSQTQQHIKFEELLKIHNRFNDIQTLKSDKTEYTNYFRLVHETGIAFHSKIYDNQRNNITPTFELNTWTTDKIRFIFGHDLSNNDNVPENYINLDNRLGKLMLSNPSSECLLGMRLSKEHSMMEIIKINCDTDKLPSYLKPFKALLSTEQLKKYAHFFEETTNEAILKSEDFPEIRSNLNFFNTENNLKRTFENDEHIESEIKKQCL